MSAHRDPGTDAPMAAASLLDSLLEDESGAHETREAVLVRDRRGRLIFEYDPSSDRAVLHVPSGDLDLRVPNGALRMSAKSGVHVESEAELSLRGARRVEIASGRENGKSARIAMDPGELSIVASVVSAAAERAEVFASKMGVRAQSLESHVDRVRHVVRVLDVSAVRIVERAKDVYRETEGLAQTRAGRLRLVAQKAVQIVGENALVKARDVVKVRGERIHLA
jgi:hypothetical protein